MRKSNTIGQVRRKQERRRKLMREWREGGFETINDLALRHGVSDVTICHDLQFVREIAKDHFLESAGNDLDKQMSRLEALVGKGFKDHELSSFVEVDCRLCNGKGQDEEKKECMRCEGEGYQIKRQPGDSKHLVLVLNAVKEICRLKGYYPEKIKKVVNETRKEISLFIGADPELVMEHKIWLTRIRESKNGYDNRDEAMDVEFEETNEEEE